MIFPIHRTLKPLLSIESMQKAAVAYQRSLDSWELWYEFVDGHPVGRLRRIEKVCKTQMSEWEGWEVAVGLQLRFAFKEDVEKIMVAKEADIMPEDFLNVEFQKVVITLTNK